MTHILEITILQWLKKNIHIKSEAIENRELDLPFNNDERMIIKEEFSETRHIRLVHEKNKPYCWKFQCTICQSRFGSKSEFHRHFAKVHENKPESFQPSKASQTFQYFKK